MNGLDEVRVSGEGLERSCFIPSEERREIVLLPIRRRQLEPGECVFQVAPDPLNRVQLRTIGRQEHEAHVVREAQVLGCMRPTVVQEQEMQAIREGLREGVDEELEHLGVQIGQFQEEPVTRGGLDGPIDIEPCEDVLHRSDGLHPTGGQASAANGQ
jgi:hypothetical protein